MRSYTLDEIRRCFSTSTDFNEIFDVFQFALTQKVQDVEPFRLLFWNPSLTVDEVRLFGEKLAGEFPLLAYDVYLWLASVFEVTYSSNDNFELALTYYEKAAVARPGEADPYVNAIDCYDPDLNIPPLLTLVEFVKRGLPGSKDPAALYRCLAQLYERVGDTAQSDLYRRKADEAGTGPDERS